MNIKNGFLLVELMIGVTISTFFILIITYYIIEAKNVQLQALQRAETLSLTRNQYEKKLAYKGLKNES